jgi:hypothetical protein
MESLVLLMLVGSVLAMAVGLYRIAKHAIGALRTFERERTALVAAPAAASSSASAPQPSHSSQARPVRPLLPARDNVEAQLERVAEQLARVAQGQELLLQAISERALKARTPSQGVASPIVPN